MRMRVWAWVSRVERFAIGRPTARTHSGGLIIDHNRLLHRLHHPCVAQGGGARTFEVPYAYVLSTSMCVVCVSCRPGTMPHPPRMENVRHPRPRGPSEASLRPLSRRLEPVLSAGPTLSHGW